MYIIESLKISYYFFIFFIMHIMYIYTINFYKLNVDIILPYIYSLVKLKMYLIYFIHIIYFWFFCIIFFFTYISEINVVNLTWENAHTHTMLVWHCKQTLYHWPQGSHWSYWRLYFLLFPLKVHNQIFNLVNLHSGHHKTTGDSVKALISLIESGDTHELNWEDMMKCRWKRENNVKLNHMAIWVHTVCWVDKLWSLNNFPHLWLLTIISLHKS